MSFAAQMFLPSHCKVIFQVTSSSRCFPVPRCMRCPLHWAETQRCTWHITVPCCLFELEGLQHCTSMTSLCSCQAARWWFPSATGLLAGSSSCLATLAAQSSFLWCLKWTFVIAVEPVPKRRIKYNDYSGSQDLFPCRTKDESQMQ